MLGASYVLKEVYGRLSLEKIIYNLITWQHVTVLNIEALKSTIQLGIKLKVKVFDKDTHG